MFKKVILSLISVIMIITVIPGSSVYASGFSKKDSDILKKDDVIGISHSDKVGWYLEKEIPHGMEFEILGDNIKFSSVKAKHPSAVQRLSNDDRFFNPDIYISEQVGTLTIEGLWWGGILDEWFIAGAVASATIATTDNTQSKAKIKPGVSAAWQSTKWTDKGVRASICDSVGLMGNKAAWDLRLYFQ